MDLNTYGGNPGTGTLVQTVESQLYDGPVESLVLATINLKSTAVDAGNTPTTTLRGGLLLGRITATGLYKEYNPTGSDGSEIAQCVLSQGMTMLDPTGTAEGKQGHVIAKGILRSGSLILLDAQARAQLIASGRYVFGDDPSSLYGANGRMLHEISKAADYQIVVADNNTLFTAITGAVTFTLPAIAPGLCFEFLNLVDAAMAIASSEGDNIVTDNDLSADSITFGTTSHKIGGRCMVHSNAAGTKWYVRNLSQATITETIAT